MDNITLSNIIALLALAIAVYFRYKNLKLAKENQAFQKAERERKEKTQKETELLKEYAIQSKQNTFLNYMYKQTRYIDFTGFRAYNIQDVELEKIYIKLRATKSQIDFDIKQAYAEQESNGIEHDGIKEQLEKECSSEELLEFWQTDFRQKKLLIIGKPGCGKTTLSRYIALQSSQKKGQFKKHIPFFIHLYEWMQLDNPFGQLNKLIKEFYTHRNQDISFYDKEFQNNKILFIFDGLDEIGDKEKRRKTIQWFEQTNFLNNPLLITSRLSGLSKDDGLFFDPNKTVIFQIEDMTDQTIKLFCRNWFKIFIEKTNKEPRTVADEEINKQAQDLLDAIETSGQSVKKLARIPILLQLLALLYKKDFHLPEGRHLLYDKVLKLMIEIMYFKHYYERKIKINTDVYLKNLSLLAVFLSKQESRTTKLENFKKLIIEVDDEFQAEFIDSLLNKIGVLFVSENEIGFIHLSFQEYLTAYYFIENDTNTDFSILDYHQNQFWKESLLLYFNLLKENQKKAIFGVIAEKILENEYWKSMDLWEDYIEEINQKDQYQLYEAIINAFGKSIIKTMIILPMNEETDDIIWYLHSFPYFYNKQFQFLSFLKNEINQQRKCHPYIKNILFRIEIACAEDKDQRLHEEFDTYKDLLSDPKRQDLNLLFEVESCFHMIFISQNYHLFSFPIFQFSHSNLFFKIIVLKSLIDLRTWIDFEALKELIDLRELRELKELKELKHLKELKELKDLKKLKELKELKDLKDLKKLYALEDLGYFESLRDLREIRYLKELRALYLKIQKLSDQEQKDLNRKLDQEWQKIQNKLSNLSQEEIIKAFPKTDMSDLDELRKIGWQGK